MVLQTAAGVAPPGTVSLGAASKILHIHPGTLHKWTDQGVIPRYRIGERRDRRLFVAHLVAFLERDGNGAEAQRRATGRLGE